MISINYPARRSFHSKRSRNGCAASAVARTQSRGFRSLFVDDELSQPRLNLHAWAVAACTASPVGGVGVELFIVDVQHMWTLNRLLCPVLQPMRIWAIDQITCDWLLLLIRVVFSSAILISFLEINYSKRNKGTLWSLYFAVCPQILIFSLLAENLQVATGL